MAPESTVTQDAIRFRTSPGRWRKFSLMRQPACLTNANQPKRAIRNPKPEPHHPDHSVLPTLLITIKQSTGLISVSSRNKGGKREGRREHWMQKQWCSLTDECFCKGKGLFFTNSCP